MPDEWFALWPVPMEGGYGSSPAWAMSRSVWRVKHGDGWKYYWTKRHALEAVAAK
jgi:hypothetical protein